MNPETTTAQHTPGPWTREPLQRFKHDSSAGVRGPNNIYVAAALDFNSCDRDAEVEANAALIAAAPDLLAACELAFKNRCLHVKGEEYYMDERDTVAVTLRAAIAKATPPIA